MLSELSKSLSSILQRATQKYELIAVIGVPDTYCGIISFVFP